MQPISISLASRPRHRGRAVGQEHFNLTFRRTAQRRIAILTQYYPPEIGAPQARLSQLAARFAERGHEVYVVTAMPNYPQGRIFSGYGGFWRREAASGVTIFRSFVIPAQSAGLLPRLTSYFSFLLSSLLVGSLALPKVDYLLTESPPLFLGITGYILSRLKQSRWIFNISDLWPESAVRLGVVQEGWRLRAAFGLEATCTRRRSRFTTSSMSSNDIVPCFSTAALVSSRNCR